MEPVIYERIAEIEREHWWYEVRRVIIARLLEPLLPPSGLRRVLSVGCGTGAELTFLSRYGVVTGVDPSEAAIRFCRAQGLGAEVFQASVEKLPFADDTFDIAFALDVLEHVRDDRRALGELYRVLRPGRIAVIAVPAFPVLWSKADERAHHIRRYQKHELREKIERAGFAVLRLTYFNTLLFFPIAAAKLVSRVREPNFLLGAEVDLPPPWLNRLLGAVFAVESHLVPVLNLPFGISLLAIVRKTD